MRALLGICLVLIAGRLCGDEVEIRGGATLDGVVWDSDASGIQLRSLDGSGTRHVPRQRIASVTLGVDYRGIALLDPARDADLWFREAERWCLATDAVIREHGRRILWVVMHEDPEHQYRRGCLLLASMGGEALEQRRWAERALRAEPTDPGAARLVRLLEAEWRHAPERQELAALAALIARRLDRLPVEREELAALGQVSPTVHGLCVAHRWPLDDLLAFLRRSRICDACGDLGSVIADDAEVACPRCEQRRGMGLDAGLLPGARNHLYELLAELRRRGETPEEDGFARLLADIDEDPGGGAPRPLPWSRWWPDDIPFDRPLWRDGRWVAR